MLISPLSLFLFLLLSTCFLAVIVISLFMSFVSFMNPLTSCLILKTLGHCFVSFLFNNFLLRYEHDLCWPHQQISWFFCSLICYLTVKLLCHLISFTFSKDSPISLFFRLLQKPFYLVHHHFSWFWHFSQFFFILQFCSFSSSLSFSQAYSSTSL